MGKLVRFKKFFFLAISLYFLQSCASIMRQPAQPEAARIGEVTQSSLALKELPEPKTKVVAAVYQFRDQTGQYKLNAGFSTAVTQGGTNILVKALKDSGWFVPIERENVNNLLNERKIVRSTRAQYKVTDGLKPLLYASIILEGGIVSYDQNVITGGAGLRYFGAGGSEEYRQDRVTVYLRAISVQTGEVLKVIYVSKTLLSQAIDVGLFRFVSFKRLLEAEAGYTYNEPSQIAVTEAINKAGLGMVLEGAQDGLWLFKEPRSAVDKAVLDYKKEQEEAPNINMLGQKMSERRTNLGLTLNSSSLLYLGDYPNPKVKTGLEVGIQYNLSSRLGVAASYGISRIAAEGSFLSKVSYLETNLLYRILPNDIISPYLFGGFGVIGAHEEHILDFNGSLTTKSNVGLGLEYVLNKNIGIHASADYNVLMNDGLDEIDQGKYNDFYWRGKIGVTYYFGSPLMDRQATFKRN